MENKERGDEGEKRFAKKREVLNWRKYVDMVLIDLLKRHNIPQYHPCL